MSKIVFVIPNMTGGGTERVISMLADEYIRMGHEVAIMQFAGYEHAYDLNPAIEDFSIAAQSSGNPLTMVKRAIAMRKYFKANPDCHVWAFCVMGAVFSVLSTRFMRRKPFILVGERNDPRSCNTPRIRNWAYHRADVITFQTKEAITLFDEKVAAKAVVIPNPLDATTLPAGFEGERKHRVVTVGRLHKQKNHRLLLEAFKDFRDRLSENRDLGDFDYTLEFYGQGPLEEETKAYATELGIEDCCIWHGFCSDVKEQIIDASMFVLSSDFEGISNSMLEAIAMGIPVISTDCPIYGARSYITDGVSGFLTEVGNRAELAEAMVKLALDKDLQEQFSVNGASIRNEYSVETIAQRFLEADGHVG